MKPELYLSDALGAVGKPMFRVHTAGSVGGTTAIVAASHVQAGKHRTVLAVAFEKQSEGNAQFALGSGKGRLTRCRRRLRPVHPGLHPAQRGPRAHRLEGGGQGPAQRPEEPLRPPQDRGHLHREGQGLADDVGADPVPRVVPLVRRRLRRGHHRRGGRQGRGGRRTATGVDPGVLVPLRAAQLPRPRSGAPGRRPPVRRRRLRARPASPIRAARSTPPSCTCPSRGCEPIWLEAFGLAEEGEGWKLVDDGTTELGGSLPDQRLRRRALQQSHRRLGPAAVRRGRQPGAGRGRRAPGRRGQGGHRHGLRGQQPVLQHLGRRAAPCTRSTSRDPGVRRAPGWWGCRDAGPGHAGPGDAGPGEGSGDGPAEDPGRPDQDEGAQRHQDGECLPDSGVPQMAHGQGREATTR